MQIIDIYIRDGRKYEGEAYFPTQTRLVDTSIDFTNGNFKVGQLIKNLNSDVVGRITAIAPSGNDTLDIDGGDFSGSNQPYLIYDDYTKLELFKDESVSIIDSIQNVKDPSKIFTPFSQQFTVPASKHNNKFFKHYYDSKIANSFDARFKGDGLIQLNGIDYKKGKFSLTSVELKNNVAYSYKLVFTGETIEFKQLLAEDELSSLTFPESLNFEYTSDFVEGKMVVSNQDLLFPLITHSKNMRFGYNNNEGYKDAITNTYLNYTDLKPALRAKVIIDAIENTYPQIKFSKQFFNSYFFKKLYLWLHREEGYLSNSNEGGGVQTISSKFFTKNNSDFNFDSGVDVRPARPRLEQRSIFHRESRVEYFFTLTVNVPDQNLNYTVQIFNARDSSILYEESLTGDGTVNWLATNYLNDLASTALNLNFVISTENTLGISQSLQVEQRYVKRGNVSTDYIGYYSRLVETSQNTVNIANQMPKMKIFDFLKNLFMMFNLTAYKENDIITVLPLDDYYNAGKTYDITKYVDTSKKTVSKLVQFKNMIFKFKSKKSYLVQYSDELQGNKFAEESYGDDQWDGTDYKIEVDFEKMMYERLTDEQTKSLTNIMQGAMLDKKFEPTIGSPLLFFPILTSSAGALKFQRPDGDVININVYNRPSNYIFTGSSILGTLNYGIEADEWGGSTYDVTSVNSKDLFTKYYQNYVTNLFNRNARKTNVSAYLPLNIILKYRLNDIFVIGTTRYRINSIKTNLLTNKSDLELYNLIENVSQISNSQDQNLNRVQNLETTNVTSNSIFLQWEEITEPNFLGYAVFVDDEFWGFNSPGDLTAGITALESDTTYKTSLRANYIIDGAEVISFDTDLFATTL